jgi:hypothetical protein
MKTTFKKDKRPMTMKRLQQLFFLIAFSITAASVQAQAPYTIRVTEVPNMQMPALQSFCYAQYNGYWLLFGGRTNGFHGVSDPSSAFPTRYDNQRFWVIDLANNKSWSAPIPAAYLQRLRATNIQFYQDGNTLFCNGGYGSTCDDDQDSCYQTFPYLSALNISGLVTAIVNNQTTGLEKYITSIQDERMRVTGGALKKLGSWYYLIFGHNYNSIYKGGITGLYTEQVRKFQISGGVGGMTITNYQALTTKLPYGGYTQFHRRDLNTVNSIMPDQTLGVTAYGGVFTKEAGPYPNPVYIGQSSGGATTINIDTTFQQKFCLYDCAYISLYDQSSSTNYTSFLGGITNYYYDKNNTPTPSNAANFMPFFNHVSTIARNKNMQSKEFPQLTPALPGYIGANAIFIAAANTPVVQGSEIIDYAKLGKSTLLGWMYGGILATAPQSSEFNPTYASGKVYAVYLDKN